MRYNINCLVIPHGLMIFLILVFLTTFGWTDIGDFDVVVYSARNFKGKYAVFTLAKNETQRTIDWNELKKTTSNAGLTSNISSVKVGRKVGVLIQADILGNDNTYEVYRQDIAALPKELDSGHSGAVALTGGYSEPKIHHLVIFKAGAKLPEGIGVQVGGKNLKNKTHPDGATFAEYRLKTVIGSLDPVFYKYFFPGEKQPTWHQGTHIRRFLKEDELEYLRVYGRSTRVEIKTTNGYIHKYTSQGKKIAEYNISGPVLDNLIAVRVFGPGYGTEPYKATKPKIKDGPVADLTGWWTSSLGVDYQIHQTKKVFAWRAPMLKEKAQGRHLPENQLEVQWTGGKSGDGSARGKIMEINNGKATLIKWDNGIVFKRKLIIAEVVPVFFTDIEGTWISNLGVEYIFKQNGNTFTWKAAQLNENAHGKLLVDNYIEAHWSGTFGKGTVRGKVTKIDNGKAARIEWNNQAIFTRKNPLISQYINIAGTWKSNIGLVYEINQEANIFTWKVTNRNQTATGTLNGKNISAKWREGILGGTEKGTITQVDDKNVAKKIQWNNGVIFER